MKRQTLLVIAAVLMAVACNTADTAAPSSNHTVQLAASAGQTYTCPMHPEVVQDGPGKCPKCGMALVPK